MTNKKNRDVVPIQHVNQHRKNNTYGYVEPDVSSENRSFDHPAVAAANAISDYVRKAIVSTFGRSGMQALWVEFPNLFSDIEASVVEAYVDGHHTAWGEESLRRSAESQAAIGRMVVAMITPPKEGDTPEQQTLRILAANAGVDVP